MDLIFGTSRLHHIPRQRDRVKLLHKVYDLGIRTFDTAPSYGMGIAEMTIGDAFSGDRSIKINTKVGISVEKLWSETWLEMSIRKLVCKSFLENVRPALGYEDMMQQYEQSLKYLRVKKVNALLFHEPTADNLNVNEAKKFVNDVKPDVKYFGVAGSEQSIDVVDLLGSSLTQIIQSDWSIIQELRGQNPEFGSKYLAAFGYMRGLSVKKAKTKIQDLNLLKSDALVLSSSSIEHVQEIYDAITR